MHRGENIVGNRENFQVRCNVAIRKDGTIAGRCERTEIQHQRDLRPAAVSTWQETGLAGIRLGEQPQKLIRSGCPEVKVSLLEKHVGIGRADLRLRKFDRAAIFSLYRLQDLHRNADFMKLTVVVMLNGEHCAANNHVGGLDFKFERGFVRRRLLRPQTGCREEEGRHQRFSTTTCPTNDLFHVGRDLLSNQHVVLSPSAS